MANLVTEIYVSIDGLNFVKLDLYKDESISMKYKSKDLQDVSKIFSPYSQSFTFPATPKNRNAFGFFGDTDVIKVDQDSKFTTKIYTDGVLNLQGFIQLSDVSYKQNKPTDFTGNFATSMTNLKDRIGDDLISDLATLKIDWKPSEVFNRLKGATNLVVEGVNVSYFVPLISSNRVLRYNANIDIPQLDNIAYNSIVSPLSNNVIKPSELRPCISLNSIVDLIKNKYKLQVTAPLDLRKEYTDAYVWCNYESISSNTDGLLTIKNNFGSVYFTDSRFETLVVKPLKYLPSRNLDNSIKIIKQSNFPSYDNFISLKVRFEGLFITGSSSSIPSVILKVIRKSDNINILSKSFDLVGNNVDCILEIDDVFFQVNQLEFFVYAQFNQPTLWNNCVFDVFFKYYSTSGLQAKATYHYNIPFNNNSVDVGGATIDLFKSLPNIKVIDFLTSYFKTYNISVFDTSPDNEDLFWLTPEDIQTTNLTYSKATVDYTPFVDITSFKKSVPSNYTYYNFKHATSKYKSNIDYLTAAGLEYGQTVYPAIKPLSPVEFKIETIFTLMTPVDLSGAADIVTYYGFDNSTPSILDTGETRYTPNYGELTIFYSHGNQPLNRDFGVQNISSGGANINSKLSSYMKVMPFNLQGKSFAFSILVFKSVSYLDSLYKRYYEAQTLRLLDPNVLSQEFTLNLPTNEMYLNEATTTQNGGQTPTGFRLQNDIIIGENLFSILDATIDITTGKTKLTLLNY